MFASYSGNACSGGTSNTLAEHETLTWRARAFRGRPCTARVTVMRARLQRALDQRDARIAELEAGPDSASGRTHSRVGRHAYPSRPSRPRRCRPGCGGSHRRTWRRRQVELARRTGTADAVDDGDEGAHGLQAVHVVSDSEMLSWQAGGFSARPPSRHVRLPSRPERGASLMVPAPWLGEFPDDLGCDAS